MMHVRPFEVAFTRLRSVLFNYSFLLIKANLQKFRKKHAMGSLISGNCVVATTGH